MSIPDALLLDGTAIDPSTRLVDTVVIDGGTINRTYYWQDRMAFYRPDVSLRRLRHRSGHRRKGPHHPFGTWSVPVRRQVLLLSRKQKQHTQKLKPAPRRGRGGTWAKKRARTSPER